MDNNNEQKAVGSEELKALTLGKTEAIGDKVKRGNVIIFEEIGAFHSGADQEFQKSMEEKGKEYLDMSKAESRPAFIPPSKTSVVAIGETHCGINDPALNAPFDPTFWLTQIADYFKEQGEVYTDCRLHVETALYKFNQIKK